MDGMLAVVCADLQLPYLTLLVSVPGAVCVCVCVCAWAWAWACLLA